MVAQALCRYGIETFLPEISFSAVNQRQRRTPLFPGYLFIYIDLNVDEPIRWYWITGFRYIVSSGDWLVPISDESIRLIRRKLEELDIQLVDSACQFAQGDLVSINDSPFRAMLGVFNGPVTFSSCIHKLLFGLSNAARLRIRPSALEKVSGSTDSLIIHRPGRARQHCY